MAPDNSSARMRDFFKSTESEKGNAVFGPGKVH
jgi:hypothetical protein